MLFKSSIKRLKRTLDLLKTSLDKRGVFAFLGYLALIDILFLPYFPSIIMPYSLPIILITLVIFGGIKNDRDFKLFIIMSLFVSLSALLSLFVQPFPEYIMLNIKRAFQFLTTFAYYFYFKWVSRSYKYDFQKILLYFIVYTATLAFYFFIDPNFLIVLKQNIYSAGGWQEKGILMGLRFSYMFSDPNTAGYFIVCAILFYAANYRLSQLEKLILVISTMILLISFQSTGVTIALALALLLYFFQPKYLLEKRTYKNAMTILALLGIIAMIIASLFSNYYKILINYFGYYSNRMGSNAGGNRFLYYQQAISNYIPFLWGQGYVLLDNINEYFYPHSDHFRMIYSYGILAYIASIYLLFKDILKRANAFIVPAFVAFSFNTLIDEQKFLALFLILLAVSLRNNNEGLAVEKHEK